MAGPLSQTLLVPDVGVGPGPFPSPAWIAGTLSDLTRLGLEVAATNDDIVTVLCSGVGGLLDPINEANPNILGSFVGGGMKPADLSHATACVYYAFLRYPPPPGGTPTVGLTFEMVGT